MREETTEMEKCLVTVAITCFNAEETIERAVLSAVSQTWRPIEILVIDDASTDSSVTIVEKLQATYPKIRLIKNTKNTGVATARNILFAESKGEIVCFFDDDDYSVPSRIQEQWERIIDYEKSNNTNLIICYCNRNVIKHGEHHVDHIVNSIGRTLPEPSGEVVATFILGIDSPHQFSWGVLGSGTLMLRKSTFEKIGTFDAAFRRCEEWDYAIRGAFQGAHFIAVDQPLITQYKTHAADKSGNVSLKYSLLLRSKYRDYLQSQKSYLRSVAIARMRHHGAIGNVMRARFWRFVSCLA